MCRSARPLFQLVLLSLALVVALSGCSEDPFTGDDPVDDPGLVRGDVNTATGDFELSVATAGDPNNPIRGPFTIHGRNIHYDESLGALVAELSVVNHSRTAFPEPVGLTFVSLQPEGVEVQNPDNGIYGPGAAIVFEFENDDAMWTPGESSFPRPVHFTTERGRAVAFVARIDVGPRPGNGGAIGGIVWHDANENGEMDPDERGLRGVEVFMTRDLEEDVMIPEILYRALTDENGMYRFDRLREGMYTVTKGPNPRLKPTTPTEIHVILVDDNGQVSEFLAANFGCVPADPPDSTFVEVGDWVKATGKYVLRDKEDFPPRLLARIVEVKDCDGIRPSFQPIDDDCFDLPLELRGPVTQVNVERRTLQVMDTWMWVPPDSLRISTDVIKMLRLEDIEIGDRVRAEVTQGPGALGTVVRELSWWDDDSDMVLGFVRGVIQRPERRPVSLIVFDTQVDLTNLTTDRP